MFTLDGPLELRELRVFAVDDLADVDISPQVAPFDIAAGDLPVAATVSAFAVLCWVKLKCSVRTRRCLWYGPALL